MAYQTRCPECQVKIRLEDTPAADDVVECPKCQTEFSPAGPSRAAAPPPKKDTLAPKKPKGEKPGKSGNKGSKSKAPPGPGKKRKSKKKKSNPVVLALMLGGALVILTCIVGIGYLLLSKSSKMEEMMSHIPGDFNHARGMNASLIRRYPGYVGELNKQMAVAVKECADDVAAVIGLDPATVVDYAIVAKKKEGGLQGQVIVIRTSLKFDKKALATAYGPEQVNAGQAYHRATGRSGIMNNAYVYAPSDRIVVIIPAVGAQDQVLGASVGGLKAKDASFYGKLGNAGTKITAANIWVLMYSTGDLKNYINEMGTGIKESNPALSTQMGKAKMFGMWVKFGAGGVRLGGGIDCDSKESASSLATTIAEGPMGRGDDSEPPNDFKKVYFGTGSKEFKANFMANMKYSNTGDCAYFETIVPIEKATQLISQFNNPLIGDSK